MGDLVSYIHQALAYVQSCRVLLRPDRLASLDEAADLLRKLSLLLSHPGHERACGNQDCGWTGLLEQCVTPRNKPDDLLCPACYEAVDRMGPEDFSANQVDNGSATDYIKAHES